MESIPNVIAGKIAAGSFEFSKHAVDQMMQGRILVSEVKEALAAPEVLEIIRTTNMARVVLF